MYHFQTQIQNHYLISFFRLPQIITLASGVKINVASHRGFHYQVQQNIVGAVIQ